MKNITVVLVLCLLVGISIAALSRSSHRGQGSGNNASSSIAWNKQTTDVNLANNQLRVKFDAAFATTRWRVGVHVADAPKATLTLALLSLRSNSNKPFLAQIQSVVNWPQGRIRNEAGTIEYRGAPETDNIVVHIVLPASAQLQIEAGEKVLFASAVSRDILIDKNGVSEKPMKSMATLMAITLVNPTSSARDVIVNASGAKIVSLANLRKHLQASARPRFPAGVSLARPEHVIIKGTIDAQGNVVNTAIMRGDGVLADACLSALVSWKFSPFIINGEASEVIGTFVFGFDPNGTVLVPALGDGSL